jgi:hypothetical protein
VQGCQWEQIRPSVYLSVCLVGLRSTIGRGLHGVAALHPGASGRCERPGCGRAVCVACRVAEAFWCACVCLDAPDVRVEGSAAQRRLRALRVAMRTLQRKMHGSKSPHVNALLVALVSRFPSTCLCPSVRLPPPPPLVRSVCRVHGSACAASVSICHFLNGQRSRRSQAHRGLGYLWHRPPPPSLLAAGSPVGRRFRV